MKKIMLAAILSALSLTVAAQTAMDGNTVTIKAKDLKISIPDKIVGMTPSDFQPFVSTYDLSNGGSLTLFSRGLKKYARLHGEAWHEIVATSPNSFVALDKQLQMTIDRHDNGEVSGELLMVVPDHLADGTTKDHVVTVAFR